MQQVVVSFTDIQRVVVYSSRYSCTNREKYSVTRNYQQDQLPHDDDSSCMTAHHTHSYPNVHQSYNADTIHTTFKRRGCGATMQSSHDKKRIRKAY